MKFVVSVRFMFKNKNWIAKARKHGPNCQKYIFLSYHCAYLLNPTNVSTADLASRPSYGTFTYVKVLHYK